MRRAAEIDIVDPGGDERNQSFFAGLAVASRRRLNAQHALRPVLDQAGDGAERLALAIDDGHADQVGPVELVLAGDRKGRTADEDARTAQRLGGVAVVDAARRGNQAFAVLADLADVDACRQRRRQRT